eukprot:5035569-Amphidinium_carterae.1
MSFLEAKRLRRYKACRPCCYAAFAAQHLVTSADKIQTNRFNDPLEKETGWDSVSPPGTNLRAFVPLYF